ncbi:hypothetical protein niasHT_017015 [Heterodera trifolii]|uniref:Uncharacterized protein n=1 Tax=Heterodera trifolii TaxID=157864 RepID=A0ABD2KXW6_9BILA
MCSGSDRSLSECLCFRTYFPGGFISPSFISSGVSVCDSLPRGAIRPRPLSVCILFGYPFPESSHTVYTQPEAMFTEILTPRALEPRILSPEIGMIKVLSPEFLSPRIISPEQFAILVLSPAILSPEILSRQKMVVEEVAKLTKKKMKDISTKQGHEEGITSKTGMDKANKMGMAMGQHQRNGDGQGQQNGNGQGNHQKIGIVERNQQHGTVDNIL